MRRRDQVKGVIRGKNGDDEIMVNVNAIAHARYSKTLGHDSLLVIVLTTTSLSGHAPRRKLRTRLGYPFRISRSGAARVALRVSGAPRTWPEGCRVGRKPQGAGIPSGANRHAGLGATDAP